MTVNEGKPVLLLQSLAYAAPMIVTCFLFVPVQSLLAGLYAKYFGLSLTVIASVVFAARIFDAVIDPLIGYCSDWVRAKTGTRKPWIFVGNVLLVASSYFLFVPPENVSVGYFLGWYFAFYLAFTMADIPHYAWGGEIAVSSQEKTRIYALRIFFWFAGATLYTGMPLLPFFGGEGFTPQTLKWSVIASAFALLPILFVCMRYAPNGRQSVRPKKESIGRVMMAFYQNKPLLNFLAGFALTAFGFGMNVGLTFFFADGYLGLGRQLPLVLTIGAAMGVSGALIVYRLPIQFEKHHIYGVSVILTIFGMAGFTILKPGEGAFLPFLIFYSLILFGNAITQISAASLLSDIADYGCWKFKSDRAATYFASYTFLLKAAFANGMSLAIAVVGWYGFNAMATAQNAVGDLAVRLLVGVVPALLLSVALIFVFKIPINARRHAIIRKRIASRLRRQGEQALSEKSAPDSPASTKPKSASDKAIKPKSHSCFVSSA